MAAPPFSPGRAKGLGSSTFHDRIANGRSLRFWYVHRSKKVWFRRRPAVLKGKRPRFFYEGRPILHRSELSDGFEMEGFRTAQPGGLGRSAVRWGIGVGLEGAGLYLLLWARWTWIHLEAFRRSERLTVEIVELR